jgi:hypothetical protein
MRASDTSFRLILGASSALVTGVLLYTANLHIGQDISQLLIVLSGMTTMATFTALQRLIEGDGKRIPSTTFNETFLSRSIGESKIDRPPAEPINLPPWDLSASQLVGIDNALALARLRMDLERELRRIAHESHIDVSTRPAGAISFARELARKGIIPAALLTPVQEVVTICSRAIHGQDDVPNELAFSVLRVGGQILEELRPLPVARKNSQTPYEPRGNT